MNKIDPSLRYAADTVRAYNPTGEQESKKRDLNAMAKQIASQYDVDTISPVMVRGILRLVEFGLFVVSGIAIFLFYVGLRSPMIWEYAVVILAGSALSIVVVELVDGYQMAALRNPLSYTSRIILACCGSFALLSLLGFMMKISEAFSRIWFVGWLAAGLGLIILLRFILARLFRRWARNGTMERRALIVGGGKTAESLIRSLERQPFNDIRICGIFDDRDDSRSPPIVAGYPKLGTVDELIEFARIARIDMLIVSLPLTAELRLLSMLKQLWVLPVDIRLSAHSNQLHFRPRSYSFIGAVPMLDIFDKPINDWDSVAKRAFDIVFSVLGIIVTSPIMMATAIAIKLESKGPILFRQRRHGFNNEFIEVLKFRSMYTEQCDPSARNAVTKDDPRVTRVGKFIRKTSIDELPQFFNALRGDLSLVGPRPHAITAQSHNRLYNEVVDGYFARHRVKPGVTGWAQINGWRGEIDSDVKIKTRTEFDLYYIENWSLLLDLKILLLTPIKLMNTENAY